MSRPGPASRWWWPLLVALVLLVWAAPASADPAGPTDYRSEILLVDPPAPGVELAILGGDSFVELAARPGVEVLVLGYEGEPYLRFGPDGTVVQNERSPARWLNDDRFGETAIPAEADPGAEPRWVEVADDGRFAWHDHRAHWMNPDRPIGAEPGDTILEAVIPISVDGSPTEVHVRSALLPDPAVWPMLAGAVVAATLAGATVAGWRREPRPRPASTKATTTASAPVGLLALVAAWALVATGFGLAAVVGLPGEAAPGPARWLLPAAAAVVALFGLAVASGRLLVEPLRALVVPAAAAVAGAELLLWVWLRRQAMARALIPSEAPASLDRAVLAGSVAVGLIAVLAALWALVEHLGRPRPVPVRR